MWRHHLKIISQLLPKMSPLPLPSDVACGGEADDELETAEEEVGSLAQPSTIIEIYISIVTQPLFNYNSMVIKL